MLHGYSSEIYAFQLSRQLRERYFISNNTLSKFGESQIAHTNIYIPRHFIESNYNSVLVDTIKCTHCHTGIPFIIVYVLALEGEYCESYISIVKCPAPWIAHVMQ